MAAPRSFPTEPVRKLWVFTVEGRGAFPVDMLRYDSCWPASEGRDVHAIGNDREREPRRVTLQGLRAPTEARWASFCWHVVQH